MFITIAICTWNRAAILDRTLDNLRSLIIDEDFTYEVIIVNNNCTDATDSIIEKHIQYLPIKKIFEASPGLSNARNAALRNASGEYIIWTDDDVLVDKYWLKAYVTAFKRWPDTVVFGGPIEPWFEGTPPKWLQKGLKSVADAFATRDLGNESIPLTVENNKLPYGANFAVRMAEQIHFLYDPNLGLKHGKIILGEETKVISDILNAGFSGRWVPEAKVKHWLPVSRQNLNYLKRYYMGHGRTRHEINIPEDCKMLFNYPRWAIRRLVELYFSFFFKRIFYPPHVWLPVFVQLSFMIGWLKGYKAAEKK